MLARKKDSPDEKPPPESNGGYAPSPVESWRLHILTEAGYPFAIAQRLAASSADLHVSCEMLAGGCDPETAAEILL